MTSGSTHENCRWREPRATSNFVVVGVRWVPFSKDLRSATDRRINNNQDGHCRDETMKAILGMYRQSCSSNFIDDRDGAEENRKNGRVRRVPYEADGRGHQRFNLNINV